MLLKLILFACTVLLCCYECTGAMQNGTSFTRHDREASRLGVLARRRRYVAFPEGSSFSVAVCATIGVIGNPNVNYLSYGLNWGVAYDLPNQTWVLDHVNGFKKTLPAEKSIQKRKERRDVYQKLEAAIENMGYSGRACILRALCESSKYFFKRKNTMIEEMVKTIFSFPRFTIFSHEHSDIKKYANAFKTGPNIKDCAAVYKNCGFSLLGLVFGKYSRPLNEYL